jgi:hypothetical protein
MKFLENDKLAHITGQLTEATICERVINGRIEAFTMKRAGTDKKYAHALGEKYQEEIKEEQTEYTQFQQMQKIRSGSLGATSEQESSSSSLDQLRRKLQGPPSPKAKRIKFDTVNNDMTKIPPKGRRRSASLSSVPALTYPNKGPSASAMRSRSDSYDAIISQSYFPYSYSPLGNFHDSSTQRLMTDLILTLNASFPDYDFSNVRPSHFSRMSSSSLVMNRVNEKLSELAASMPEGVNFLSHLWNAMDDVIHLKDCEVYSYAPQNKDDDDDDPLSFLTQTLDGYDGSVPLWTMNYFFVNKKLQRIVLLTCVQTMRTEVEQIRLDDDDTYTERMKDSDFGSPERISRQGSGFDGGLDEDEDEEDGGQDYDMDCDNMNQAVPI